MHPVPFLLVAWAVIGAALWPAEVADSFRAWRKRRANLKRVNAREIA